MAFQPKAINNKIWSSKIYITTSINKSNKEMKMITQQMKMITKKIEGRNLLL
jgi:hypothetical protein